MNKLLGIIVLIVILLGGMWFLTKNSKVQTPPENESATTETSTNTQSETDNKIIDVQANVSLTTGVKEFAVEGSEFKFSPATITVKKGDTVKISFKNTGSMPHDFKIDEFNVATKILSAGSAMENIEFVADKTGTFEYYCSVGSHRARGMFGKLIVE